MAKVIPASPGKIDAGLPAQGVWYPQFWGLPLATRRPPQWPRENCRRPLCPPPLCSPSPFLSSPKPLNNSALRSVLTNLAMVTRIIVIQHLETAKAACRRCSLHITLVAVSMLLPPPLFSYHSCCCFHLTTTAAFFVSPPLPMPPPPSPCCHRHCLHAAAAAISVVLPPPSPWCHHRRLRAAAAAVSYPPHILRRTREVA